MLKMKKVVSKKTFNLYQRSITTLANRSNILADIFNEDVSVKHLLYVLWMTELKGSSASTIQHISALRKHINITRPDFPLIPWMTTQEANEVLYLIDQHTRPELMDIIFQKYQAEHGNDRAKIMSLINQVCVRQKVKKLTKADRKNTHITLDMITQIERKTGGSRIDWLNDCSGSLKSFRASVLILRPIFLTGIRPSEIWSARLLVPKISEHGQQKIKDGLGSDLTKTITDGLYCDIEDQVQIDLDEGLSLLSDLHKNHINDLPPILVIYTKKQGTVPLKNRMKFRSVALSGITFENLESIYFMTMIKHFIRYVEDQKVEWDYKLGQEPTDEKRLAYLTKRLATLLQQALKTTRLDELPFDLVTLRHNFASRTRSGLPLAQATALHGNSSPRTTRGYGQKNIKKGSKVGGGANVGWLPTPDPAQVQRIENRITMDKIKNMVSTPTAQKVGKEKSADQVPTPSGPLFK